MSVPPPVPGPPVVPAPPASRPAQRRGLLIALAVACGVLLLTGAGLGALVAAQLGARAADGTPSPTPTNSHTPTPTPTPDAASSVAGIPVVDETDFGFGLFMLTTDGGDGRLTSLYMVGANPGDATVFAGIDATAFAADGTILSRADVLTVFRPDELTMHQLIFTSPIADAVEIRIEQTSLGEIDPPVTGDVTLREVALTEDGVLVATLDAALSAPHGDGTAYIVGTIDGVPVVACWDWPDMPATGEFEIACRPEVTLDPPEGLTRDEIVNTAEYDVLVEFGRTWEE